MEDTEKLALVLKEEKTKQNVATTSVLDQSSVKPLRIIFTNSIGPAHGTGELFSEAIELLLQLSPTEIMLVLADMIQRYGLTIEEALDNDVSMKNSKIIQLAKQSAMDKSVEWIEENKSTYEGKVECKKWNDFQSDLTNMSSDEQNNVDKMLEKLINLLGKSKEEKSIQQLLAVIDTAANEYKAHRIISYKKKHDKSENEKLPQEEKRSVFISNHAKLGVAAECIYFLQRLRDKGGYHYFYYELPTSDERVTALFKCFEKIKEITGLKIEFLNKQTLKEMVKQQAKQEQKSSELNAQSNHQDKVRESKDNSVSSLTSPGNESPESFNRFVGGSSPSPDSDSGVSSIFSSSVSTPIQESQYRILTASAPASSSSHVRTIPLKQESFSSPSSPKQRSHASSLSLPSYAMMNNFLQMGSDPDPDTEDKQQINHTKRRSFSYVDPALLMVSTDVLQRNPTFGMASALILNGYAVDVLNMLQRSLENGSPSANNTPPSINSFMLNQPQPPSFSLPNSSFSVSSSTSNSSVVKKQQQPSQLPPVVGASTETVYSSSSLSSTG